MAVIIFVEHVSTSDEIAAQEEWFAVLMQTARLMHVLIP